MYGIKASQTQRKEKEVEGRYIRSTLWRQKQKSRMKYSGQDNDVRHVPDYVFDESKVKEAHSATRRHFYCYWQGSESSVP